MEITEQVATVARQRVIVADLKAKATSLRAQWELDHCILLNALEAESGALAQAEEALRAATIEAFEASGRTNKAPVPGVGIRVGTKLEYDPQIALRWAHLHGLALKLDEKAFEKIATADKPDFVTAVETVSATIAQDLSKLYPAPEAK